MCGGSFCGFTVVKMVSASESSPGSVTVNTTSKIPLESVVAVKVAVWVSESMAICRSPVPI